MKPNLLFLKNDYRRTVFLCFLTMPCFAQTIGIPTVNASGGAVQITFTTTNGVGAPNYFTGSSLFTILLSDASGNNFSPIYSFNSSVFPPPNNLSSATVVRAVPMPAGTPFGSGYKIAVNSSAPGSLGISGANASQPFTLFDAFTMPSNLNGFIKCSSPAITYYILTITNTGNLIDSYGLTKTQSLYPLGSSFLSLSGTPISATPPLDPGESYTFMMLFETPNGTPPDNWNTTIVTATSAGNPAVTHLTNISTYIYCGMNNANLPDAPDMEIVKTASTAIATVGDFIDYTITIKNTSTKNASNPVIKDFLPANAELISYNKAPGETRNVTFSYNAGNNTINALVQSTMTIASLPLTIHIRVKTNCRSVPQVTNSAEVFSVSGDHNNTNDVSAASSSVNYNIAASGVGTWTGAFNNDWFDCRNWSSGVIPTNNINATIPTGTPDAQISALSVFAPADKIARTYDIGIASGASVSMINAGLLNVAGNWTAAGTFSYGNGTVTFNGFNSGIYQSISDITGKSEFYNLVINGTNNSKGLSISDGYGIFVHNNFNLLSGDMRLNGLAQLVQTRVGASSNTSLGTGKLLVDQKGQSNIHSYNYWSSPVGANNSYTVGSVLNDGTNPNNPLPINWCSGYNGAATSPLSLAPYWINKYQNQSGIYAGWSNIGQNGVLSAGQGYTMKGGGAPTLTQNYTFGGKPNNGNFASIVSANNMNLSGNPYPSALDAYAFLDDNVATITGTLYFWEQFSTNSTHITANYEGGYATLTKTGATPPASPIGVSSAGFSTRIPGRYIPIGQGFLLFGSATGGSIVFSNTQRAFVRETDAGSNPMFRGETAKDDESKLKKIRLGFNTALTRRQILLGYMESEASENFDKGFDALQIDTRADDVWFIADNKKLVINARGFFNGNENIAMGVELSESGKINFNLEGLENFDKTANVYLFDSITGIYYDLQQESVSLFLVAGIYESRFSLRFSHSPSQKNTAISESAIDVYYNRNAINIKSEASIVSNVVLYNTLGQQIRSWNLESSDSNILVLPVDGIASGTYIAKIQSTTGSTSKKIMIREQN